MAEEDQDFFIELQPLKFEIAGLRQVREAKSQSFSSLVKLAGLDKASDFRFADLTGVDFSQSDLSGFDFTGADLRGADLSRAITISTIFDDAILTGGQLERPLKRQVARKHNRERRSIRELLSGQPDEEWVHWNRRKNRFFIVNALPYLARMPNRDISPFLTQATSELSTEAADEFGGAFAGYDFYVSPSQLRNNSIGEAKTVGKALAIIRAIELYAEATQLPLEKMPSMELVFATYFIEGFDKRFLDEMRIKSPSVEQLVLEDIGYAKRKRILEQLAFGHTVTKQLATSLRRSLVARLGEEVGPVLESGSRHSVPWLGNKNAATELKIPAIMSQEELAHGIQTGTSLFAGNRF